ncbi:MAG TPA: GvpL/GvpF family gas vesicle protein [Bacillota bacterium]|nr:GvpL/GvpF family gas vesicle protein [Bacillota bacterium]
MNQTQRAYIYGITTLEANLSETLHGIGDLSVTITKLPSLGFGLIISNLPPDFGELEFEDTVKQVRVLERIMGQGMTVIPIRFGTVTKSLTDLVKSLQSHQTSIKRELQRLKGMTEVGVKVYWKKDKLKQELLQHSEYTPLVAKAQTDRTAAIELGQWIEQVVEEWRNLAISQLHEPMKKVAAGAVQGGITSVEMIYNGSFLVDSNQANRLQQVIQTLADKFGERYDFHCTTHLPPYNFVNLKINWSNQ